MNWIKTSERLPEKETPVLILVLGEVRIGEIRTEYATFEDLHGDFDYWDDPANDGQDIEWDRVTHWMPLPPLPEDT